MHVLLVGAELEENLALRYLAAAVEERGQPVELATFDDASHMESVVEAVRRSAPGVVGMSATFQFRAREFGALAQELRRSGYRGHITCGGHFPTFAFKEMLEAFPAIDTVVRHEGEETLPELCAAVSRGGGSRELACIRGIAYRAPDGSVVATPARPLIEDLDALPFPKRVGEPQRHLGIPAAFLVGTRGCYGHCTFCCIHAYLQSAGGPQYRMRSPDDVADEMMELRRGRGARMFVFHDDDFFTRDHAHDLARVTALRDALRRRGVDDVALVVKARPDDVDERVFSVLQDIGLLRVYLGIEAGSTQGLRVLGRGVDLAANRRALEFLRARDIYTCFNMLLFDPESTLESLAESLRFLRAYPDVPMNFCRTEIYVGTPLMRKLAREGRLLGDVFGWDYVIRDPRAERAFRVFSRAFLDRNFRCDGLMNSTLGLGYHLHLLRQFYPKAMTPNLRQAAEDATRRVNLDCVTRMEEILAFAGSPRAADPAALEDFTEKTTRAVEETNASLEELVATVTQHIVRAALTPRAARPARTSSSARWSAISAATIALSPLSCDHAKTQPPPPDPLPPPSLYIPDADQPPPPPPDPLPMPIISADAAPPVDQTADAGTAPDAATTKPRIKRKPLPPPPDPLPPPHVQ